MLKVEELLQIKIWIPPQKKQIKVWIYTKG